MSELLKVWINKTVDRCCEGNRDHKRDRKNDEGIVSDEKSVFKDREEYNLMDEINGIGISSNSDCPNRIQVPEKSVVVK